MKIAFHDNFLCERGTSIALYDYAYFNEEILQNNSCIIYNKDSIGNHPDVVEKFKNKFDVFGYSNWGEVDSILQKNQCDLLYLIKQGEYDGKISKNVKSVVHCVFNAGHPHGHVYSAISNSISNYVNQPVVPHMINLPNVKNNLRSILNIPDNAIVFGRHGGYEQFDIPAVHQTVYNFAINNPDHYFLFVNTKRFCPDLPNIIHLHKIVDMKEKVKFINTCDAMIWGRSEGETFGIAIGEFSTLNKPIIACKSGYQNHVKILKDKCLWYNSAKKLYDKLSFFNEYKTHTDDWNCYKEYTPEKVMKKFKEVYIDE